MKGRRHEDDGGSVIDRDGAHGLMEERHHERRKMCVHCDQHPVEREDDGMMITVSHLCACCFAAYKLRDAREAAAKIPALEAGYAKAQSKCRR